MTTNPKAARYHTRRVERPDPPEAGAGSSLPFDNEEDGFGNLDFRRPEDRTPSPGADASGDTAGPSSGNPVTRAETPD